MSRYVEVTRQGYLGRAKNSFVGALFGVFLLVAATVASFWNEGRSVKRYQDLKEGAAHVVEVASGKVDSANEGRLVHISGVAQLGSPVTDADFGQTVDAIKLVRRVEMYQWEEQVKSEQKEKIGGGVETTRTYQYAKAWRDRPVPSESFKQAEGHQNPKAFPHPSTTLVAARVDLGAFRLPKQLIDGISGAEAYAVTSLEQASEAVRESGQVIGGIVYLGANPEVPEVGDVRVSFQQVPAGEFSVVAQQKGDSLTEFTTSRGGKLTLIKRGIVGAGQMFDGAQSSNKALTWGIRGVGFVLMFAAFSMILGPVGTLAKIIPFLGRIVGAGTKLIALLLAGILWTVTVGTAWVFYRPVLGISLLIITVVLFVLVIRQLIKARSSKAGEPSLAPVGGPDVPPPMA